MASGRDRGRRIFSVCFLARPVDAKLLEMPHAPAPEQSQEAIAEVCPDHALRSLRRLARLSDPLIMRSGLLRFELGPAGVEPVYFGLRLIHFLNGGRQALPV
jgi:hypothetical protein